MIEKLVAKYKISKPDSYLIGDSQSDMEAAEKAGIQGFQIIPNQNMFPHLSFLNQ
jgi:histidinol phosphatase-like enzyme